MEKKFRRISIIFILGSIIYYGARFGYYYLKFNKKSSNSKSSEVLGITIQKANGVISSGDGLYNNSGELVFKGKNVDNYLMYSNILWRIVKVNNDNSIVLITDSTLSNLSYSNTNSEFLKSNINNWLNKEGSNTGVFEEKLNDKKKYLIKNTICLDKITNLNNITCKEKDSSKYVTLLSIGDYLNSKTTDSYINNTNDLWLYNAFDNTKNWYIKNGNLANDSINSMHGIKAVITLKNTIGKVSGKGTLDDPYTIEKKSNKLAFNSYVKLGEDLYTVYDNKNEIRLVNASLINDSTPRYINYYSSEYNPNSQKSVAYFLNNTYYNSLPYKDKLIDCEYNIGDYNTSYKDVYNKTVKTKVGMLSVVDVNTDSESKNYLLLNKHNNLVIANMNDGVTYTVKLKPTICLNKNTKFKGNGTKTNPFELEG